MSEAHAVSFEKSKIEWDGRTVSLVYGVPSNEASRGDCVVIAPGAGGPMYSPFVTYFHAELAKRGFLTVKFNFPYMEARRRFPDRKDVLEDSYRRVVEHVRSGPYGSSRFFLGGKSMGGRIASQAVAEGLAADGLFFLGYPLHPPGRPAQLRDSHLYKINAPMIFVSGTRDQFAGRDLLAGVVEKLGAKATIHWIENGDHSFNVGNGKEELNRTYLAVLALLSDWFRDKSDG